MWKVLNHIFLCAVIYSEYPDVEEIRNCKERSKTLKQMKKKKEIYMEQLGANSEQV